MRSTCALFVVALGGVLTTTTPAAAQFDARPSSPEEDRSIAPAEAPNSVKLFDGRRSTFAFQLEAGPLWSRRVSETSPADERRNFARHAPLASEIAAGRVFTTPSMRGPLFLVGASKTLFRVLDDKSFSWSVFHQEIGGGIRLGPLAPFARVRMDLMSVDVMHGQWSAQLFSPGIVAGATLHLGRLGIDCNIHADFLWRWFAPNYMVRGISFGLRFDDKPGPTTPWGDEPPQ